MAMNKEIGIGQQQALKMSRKFGIFFDTLKDNRPASHQMLHQRAVNRRKSALILAEQLLLYQGLQGVSSAYPVDKRFC